MQKYRAMAPSERTLSSIRKPALSRSPSIIQVKVECSLRMWPIRSSAMSGPASAFTFSIQAGMYSAVRRGGQQAEQIHLQTVPLLPGHDTNCPGTGPCSVPLTRDGTTSIPSTAVAGEYYPCKSKHALLIYKNDSEEDTGFNRRFPEAISRCGSYRSPTGRKNHSGQNDPSKNGNNAPLP